MMNKLRINDAGDSIVPLQIELLDFKASPIRGKMKSEKTYRI
jgi:hypothetical protein